MRVDYVWNRVDEPRYQREDPYEYYEEKFGRLR